MKKKVILFTVSLMLASCVTAHKNLPSEVISLQTLLKDMTNREQQAQFPALPFKCRQFSSYSRRAVSPTEGWFSNWDWSNFLRIEKNQGRTEYVMMDHQAPGSIVRFWMTFARGSHNGYLRIYLDGSDTPVIEGKAVDILSGGTLVGKPLSSSSSEQTNRLRRGHNLYLPIPYKKSCKVTIETDTLTGKFNENGQVEGSYVYYNINYREYDKSAIVKSFTKEDLKTNAELMADVNEKLLRPMPQQRLEEIPINTGRETTSYIGTSFKGEGAIKKLTVKLEAEDLNQALRSTILMMKFDGKETVWCPVGDFFGTGYKISPYKSWYTEVKEDGTMSCSWVMPYKKECKIGFLRLGEQNVEIKASYAKEDDKWTDNSMYFHANWFEKNRIKTVAHKGHTGEGAEDITFIELKGKGLFVGDSLTLFNDVEGGGNKWWGEGDEKIYVDGETFPSHFGTGTEDYYGYAWCRPEKFHTPFITQPDGSGNLRPGFTVNSRYRLLDQIPFTKSFKFDMELWHWKAATVNYAPTVFYYATADTITKSTTKDIENAKQKVILSKNPKATAPILKNGKIEGEAMKIAKPTSGQATSQELGGWSGGAQLWWKNGSKADELILKFKSPKQLKGQMNITYTVADDYGIFDIFLNGKQIEKNLDLYSAQLDRKIQTYENSIIKQGDNELKVVLKGINPASKPAKMFGLDLLRIK